jgi:hypothetical protein
VLIDVSPVRPGVGCCPPAGWHNTVIKIDCSTAWGWKFIAFLLLSSAAYLLLGIYGA